LRDNEKKIWGAYLMFFTNLLEANMRVKNFQFDMTYYSKTESTNKDIWEIYNLTKKNNLFVITDNQINGEGRGSNIWISTPNKSITCSFLLKQIFDNINLHSLLIPLAIIKGIKQNLNINLKIKWPNDIVYENKKISGILIETKKNNSKFLLNIGIGINVNEEIDDFPDNLKNKITSLKMIANKTIQREPLLANIFNELDKLISTNDDNYIINEWIKNCNHLNQEINFYYNNKLISGIFKSINNNGQAVIQNSFKSINYNGAIELV